MKRRVILALMGTLPLAGCIGDSNAPETNDTGGGTGAGEPSESEEDGENETNESDQSEDNEADASPSLSDARGPVRGKNDVDLEVQEVEDRDEDEVKYLADENSVRYVAGWRHTNREEMQEGAPPEREPFYETTPFDHWGETHCLSAAARAAADHVNEELGVDEVGTGITSGVEGHDRAAFVSVSTTLDRDGDIVYETAVEFETLVTTTPATVEARYVLDEQEYERDVPVYARFSVVQQE